MPTELTTQEQFDRFADEVARELGAECSTAPDPGYTHMLARLITDSAGRVLSLRQHDCSQPARLKVYARLPENSGVLSPPIGVTASSARHVAREITRRLHPRHAEAIALAAELTALRETEAASRRAVAQAVAGALPGARINEQYRCTEVFWQRAPQEQTEPVETDSVHAVIGASGERLSVETSGCIEGIVAMLAAFAQQ
ncbi:hypothetical protein ABZV34_27040 [Streptomyces sp. NPDC005195]|uniref:hypothetical protein n=1 Tax=Streptomyces sp. NPDC005195 TaxID=3154561 RepID=UPI0033A1C388